MPRKGERRKLGVFLGVYTPTVLTILGVILYLRLGWLVGHLGLLQTLLVVALAEAVTLVTALSFSAIASNIHVGPGGAYYITSRSLGPEVGGAVGVPLFLSQAFSVTLYSYGLAESLRIIWPNAPLVPLAAAIVVLVAFLAMLGAERALKSQIPIMVMIGISLLGLLVGSLARFFQRGLPIYGPSGEVSFWEGFAVFFPAVTGVMAGLGLSGDLHKPQKAIPLGSLLAVGTGFLVYICLLYTSPSPRD